MQSADAAVVLDARRRRCHCGRLMMVLMVLVWRLMMMMIVGDRRRQHRIVGRSITAAARWRQLWLDELDVGERKVTGFALQVALPLPVDVRLGDHYDVAHLQLEGGFVVGVGHARLLYASVGGEFALRKRTNFRIS